MEDIVVSVICNAYNHEKYIREALEGFVMQKTDFSYEVLVHDDASTDGTADIIREYEAKYPELIKPIYQTENQYSQKKSISLSFQLPRVRGKYVAFCEGDDYWTDPYKLQKQVDALETNPEINICAHLAMVIQEDKQVGWIKPSEENCIFSPEQVIDGGGGFVATASLMYRSTLIEQFSKVMALDYVWQIYGSLQGGMLYLSDAMSVYRQMVSGSWSERMRNDPGQRRQHILWIIQMFQKLDEDTQGRFSALIQKKIICNRVWVLLQDKEYRKILLKENRVGYKALSGRKKIAVFAYAVFPGAEQFWQRFKAFIKRKMSFNGQA